LEGDDTQEARRFIREAVELSPDNERVTALAEKLGVCVHGLSTEKQESGESV